MNRSVISPGRAGLILLLTGQMLPLIDTSITNVALDSITHSLHATATELELIVALYGVAFAVCLALGSKLGDNHGRRRLFMWGVASFGLASLLCGMAGNIEQLLAARIVQGAGAALIVPQILATLHVTLKGPSHAKAISLFGGIGGIAFIVGQMGGGWLVSADIAGLGWRNAFFINVPICLVVLALSRRYVPETRRETPSRIDWTGTALLAMILCCLLFPMALGPQWHWSWPLKAALIAIIPLAWLMVLNARKKEREDAHPLIPPRLMQLASIRFGVLIAMLFFSVWSGFMFCMALTMQTGLGMAPWQSGNSFIALGVTYFVSAWFAPRLIARYRTSTLLLGGLAIQILGLLALIATFRHWGMNNTALTLAPATGLVGYGQALIVNSFYRIGMRDIQPDDAGAASAILSTLQQAALGLGPAIFGAILLHALQSHHGDYTQAVNVFLMVETAMMIVLALATVRMRHRLCLPVITTCHATK
ncbi:TPA: MFS transporter [Enterobacter cancerogenus]|uniref:MFS transporter n=1 Tax=Enterobacter cancerogenus TaxID=69218 RepID=UPI00018263FF|nr:MFS transporter [Enterobacter cancerogenus]EFC55374.1 transporter, major facilitator family protein [Enterobacter cancerogenus ATCC 35316]KTQ45542.1 MFS transporter [Enterobacter cancerogenus]KTQ53429.1 MFS transporter [Enterobacter cancerogenus]KTQ74073.1 MFS transporter [Enterobacter cancerogenus]KTQ83667.1 MFS transporter [Enterobacter cancerogenus]